MLAPLRPAISYAERGALRAELTVHGPPHELHSGTFGGAVHNPLQVLCELIASLHDPQGRVAISGFYDDVLACDLEERASMARAGPSDASLLRSAGVARGWGEQGFSAYERTTIRPALVVNGIVGGHTGSVGKSIIPARAVAKLGFRLVPHQHPARVARLLREHVEHHAPPTMRTTLRTYAGAEPAFMDLLHPVMQAAAQAYERGFGARPVFLRSGGTLPVVSTLQQWLGLPVVLMGFGLPQDNIHAPNESLHLPTFARAVDTSIHFLSLAAHALAGQDHNVATSRRKEIV